VKEMGPVGIGFKGFMPWKGKLGRYVGEEVGRIPSDVPETLL
jgi:hypothetical protein